MGACGCGDFSPDFKLLAPDGDVYTISVYTGCDDCATPTGLTVNRMSAEEAERWGLDMVPEFPMPHDLGTFGREGSVVLFDRSELSTRLIQAAEIAIKEVLAEELSDHSLGRLLRPKIHPKAKRARRRGP